MTEILQVPIAEIDEPILPMREQFADAPFAELCEDIGKNGITCALKLRDLGARKRVVFGHRRFKAAQVCGLQTVPAVVETMDDYEEVRQMISENTGREEVSAAESGRHYAALMEKFSLNLEQCAAMVGKSVEYVDQRVSFVCCDSDLADANVRGDISFAACRELLRVNPYTAALALRCDVKEIDDAARAKIDAHRKFLLDLCIRCGATKAVAHHYVEQWKTGLVPLQPYQPGVAAAAGGPVAAAMMPRCVVCGRDSDPGNMVDIKVHHWERPAVFKALRAAGFEFVEA
jgi:ParB/RepB/Spo0J family partition protein